jgi:hypothetical protein
VALSLLANWAGTRYTWTSAPILGLAATALLALAAFLRVERRAAEPIVPLRLFADHSFTLAQILRLTAGAAMMVFAAFLPLYMQSVKGTSPTASGLLILPAMLGMVAVSVGSGQVISRTGRYRSAWEQFDGDGRPKDPHGPATAAKTLLDQVTWWARALKDANTTTPYQV